LINEIKFLKFVHYLSSFSVVKIAKYLLRVSVVENKEIFLFEEKSQLSHNFNYIHILKETHKVLINTLIQ
jgi:hypothetical protein